MGDPLSKYTKHDPVRELAWKLHHKNGHPKGYEGPCWGPTLAEWKQAAEMLQETPS